MNIGIGSPESDTCRLDLRQIRDVTREFSVETSHLSFGGSNAGVAIHKRRLTDEDGILVSSHAC